MISRSEPGVPLTQESIDSYLEHLRSAGRVQGTIDSYRRKIGRLYQALPEDGKAIRRDTLLWWREKLAEEGCSPTGINQFIIVVNGYLEYMGARELQMVDRLKSPGELQPELTRNEYLRLLSAARSLGREQAYLLVKVFGNSDLLVQELKNLTVEAAREHPLQLLQKNHPFPQVHLPGAAGLRRARGHPFRADFPHPERENHRPHLRGPIHQAAVSRGPGAGGERQPPLSAENV